MCYSNAEELTLTWKEWKTTFSDGVPMAFMPGSSTIDLDLIKKNSDVFVADAFDPFQKIPIFLRMES